MAAPAIIVLSASDNIAVAVRAVTSGETVTLDGHTLAIRDAVALGHKVALRDIASGEKIIKYGSPIGSAVTDIPAGRHVHTHNMKSDYIPTYDRDHQRAFLKDS
jgi:predicted RecA/RadA family phage recombinase